MKNYKKIIIANWKMQLDVNQSVKVAKGIKRLLSSRRLSRDVQVVICPSFLAMTEVAKVLKGTKIDLGAQDSFYEERGAYTGEVSVDELKKIGCQYVIVGHSERRQMGETDEIVNQKVKTILSQGLVPIICVGETFDERREGNKDMVIMHQVYQALHNIDFNKKQKIIIAYEPVWVIGSGQVIDHQEAAHVASVIRQSMIDVFDGKDKASYQIIYGGSVSPGTVADFTKLANMQGTLVGGASLEAKVFVEIIKNS